MLFSVIIPSHNRLALLGEALASVRAQRFTDFEVIVVDDGSDDGTSAALAAEPDPPRILRQANRGPGAARNLGAREARGRYLAFLDSDDLWFPWTLERYAAIVSAHDRPALVFGRFVDFSDPPDLTEMGDKEPATLAFDCFLSAPAHGFFAGGGMMVLRRDAFLNAGGFAEDGLNAEDHDLALRLGTAPGFVQVEAPVTIAHRLHAANETRRLALNAAGLHRLIACEREGLYPGGRALADARHAIITRHVRPAVLALVRAGHLASAWQLYRATLRWNLRLHRARFVLGAPALMLLGALRRPG